MWKYSEKLSRVALLLGLVAVATYLLSESANAQTVSVDTVGVHIGSKHWPAAQWNNENPGIYVSGAVKGLSTVADGRYVIGTYYNSERKESVYAGRILSVSDNLDVVVGAATGYKAASVVPIVVPSVHFGVYRNLSARISYLPKVGRDGANVLHLSLEARL